MRSGIQLILLIHQSLKPLINEKITSKDEVVAPFKRLGLSDRFTFCKPAFHSGPSVYLELKVAPLDPYISLYIPIYPYIVNYM